MQSDRCWQYQKMLCGRSEQETTQRWPQRPVPKEQRKTTAQCQAALSELQRQAMATAPVASMELSGNPSHRWRFALVWQAPERT